MRSQSETDAFLVFTPRPLSGLSCPWLLWSCRGNLSTQTLALRVPSHCSRKERCLGNAALFTVQDGENSKMTFWVSAGNILSLNLNKAMTVPLIFLSWYSSEEWNGTACTARTSWWWVRSRGSCCRDSPPEISCGQGSKQHSLSARRGGRFPCSSLSDLSNRAGHSCSRSGTFYTNVLASMWHLAYSQLAGPFSLPSLLPSSSLPRFSFRELYWAPAVWSSTHHANSENNGELDGRTLGPWKLLCGRVCVHMRMMEQVSKRACAMAIIGANVTKVEGARNMRIGTGGVFSSACVK